MSDRNERGGKQRHNNTDNTGKKLNYSCEKRNQSKDEKTKIEKGSKAIIIV